jgi:hypothetical protein
MNNSKKRNPDVEKLCSNPSCRKPIERKHFGERIEDYAVYLNRKYCDMDCYRQVRQTSCLKPKVKKKQKTKPTVEPTPSKVDVVKGTQDQLGLLTPPVQKGSAPFIGPDEEPTPEEYLLKVMRDPSLSASRRDLAAKILVSAKAKAPVTTKSKKEERAENAGKVVAGSKFAPTAPPSKVVGRINS